MLSAPAKDPDEVLDYKLNWADPLDSRLETGETLLSSAFMVADGDVTITDTDWTAEGLTKVWLSGGTRGTVSVILNRVTTSVGRTYDQSFKVRIRDR